MAGHEADSHSPAPVEAADNRSDTFQQIAQAASRAGSTPEFYREALAILGGAASSPLAAIEVRTATELVVDHFHSGPTDPGFWKPTIESFLSDTIASGLAHARMFRTRNPKIRIALISCPIIRSGGVVAGAVAMVIPCRDEAQAHEKLTILTAQVNLIGCAGELISSAAASRGQSGSENAMQALKRVAGYGSRVELAFALTNNLRNRLGAEQVSLALVSGNRARILSLSGLDEVKPRTPGVAHLRAAMDEAIDRSSPIVYQSSGPWSEKEIATGYLLHKRWHESSGGAAVASIPLNLGDRCIAVLGIRHRAGEKFNAESIAKIRETVEPYAASIDMVDRANRGLIPHALQSCRKTLAATLAPENWARKVIVLALGALIAWVAFGTLEYHVSSTCRIAPLYVRHVSAPHMAILRKAPLAAGDRFKAGDTLAVFDHDELLLNKARLQADFAVARIEENKAIAEAAPAKVALARATQQQLNASLAILQHKIDRSVIIAPFDGVVIAGDLRQRVGDVLQQGDPLLEISSHDGFKLELMIPEEEITHLQMGQGGHFAASARPEESHALRITRIHPRAETIDSMNVYRVEADSDVSIDWLKAGMEGRARVAAGPRPVWWVAFRRVIDHLHLNYWI